MQNTATDLLRVGDELSGALHVCKAAWRVRRHDMSAVQMAL